ncbi:MAG: hypothetical protein ACFFA8_00050 [Promethearchaeota archaeon]
MVEANLNGLETKNNINCVDIEKIIKECVSELQEEKAKVSVIKDNNKSRLDSKSRSLRRQLNKSKHNNKYINELKNIKYVKSQVHYRNFGTY